MNISPSKIDQYMVCPRKYAFRYIDKVSDETKATSRGRSYHKMVEPVLKRGEPLTTEPLYGDTYALESVRMGQQHWPVKGEDDPIWVEQFLKFTYGDHFYCGNADLVWEAAMAPVVCDHKFTKSTRWAMTPGELRKDVAANIYAYAVLKKFKDADEVLLRWLYYVVENVDKPQYQEESQCKRVQVLVTREEVKANMSEINKTVDDIAYDTTKSRALDVAADTGGCQQYGGCVYKAHCYGDGDEPMGRKTASSW